MKILKHYSDKDAANAVTTIRCAIVLPGTVFRHGVHSQGPYLMLKGCQYVDLSTDHNYAVATDAAFTHFKVLHNAALVTGEDA